MDEIENDLKLSIDNIEINEKIKQQIFDNIIEKAKQTPEQPKVIKADFKRFVPYIAAAFMVAFMGFYIPNLVSKSNTQAEAYRSVDDNDINVMRISEGEFTMYLPSGDTFETYTIENCPQDPIYVWNELQANGKVGEDLELMFYSFDDKSVSLHFNKEFENMENSSQMVDAIIKSFQEMYTGLEITILYE